jgi:hypothetical protein
MVSPTIFVRELLLKEYSPQAIPMFLAGMNNMISNATKYRNPMPFSDLDEGDYFCSPNNEEGIIYRKLDGGVAIQISNNPNYKLQVQDDGYMWNDGVFKVEIVTMTYKEL